MGRGIIKLIRILLSILLCLFIICVNISSQELDKGEDVFDEQQYLDKVKSAMSEDNKNIETSDKDNKNDAGKKKISVGYYSYIKIILILLFIIGIIYGISYFLKKSLKIKGEIGEGALVLTNQSLGPGKWIQIVFVGGKYLVLGITNDNINLITEINDPKEIERLEVLLNEKKTEEGGSFIDVITDFFKDKLKININKKSFDYEDDSIDFLKDQKNRIDKMNGKRQ